MTNQHDNQTKKSFLDYISVTAAIATIISTILSIITFISNNENGKLIALTISIIVNICISFSLFIFAKNKSNDNKTFIVNDEDNIEKRLKELELELEEYKRKYSSAKSIYDNLICDFLKTAENLLSSINVTNTTLKINYDEVLISSIDKIRNMLDCICKIFENDSNQHISACIKTIDPPLKPIRDAKVSTLVRSKQSDGNRTDRSERIKYNSIYCMLCMCDKKAPKNKYYYQSDLRKVTNYRNPRKNWQNFYIGTITVSLIEKINGQESVIGFLCIDSLSEKAFPPEKQSQYSALAITYAKMFSMLLCLYKQKLA